MLQAVKLLLPALIPSWRFFDRIVPSPRIEFSLLRSAHDASANWQEFRPRPVRLRWSAVLKHMLWNPDWNESLFLVSCAERIMAGSVDHSSQEIFKRIKRELAHNHMDASTPYLQFRLAFISRQGNLIERHILYLSPVYRYAESMNS